MVVGNIAAVVPPTAAGLQPSLVYKQDATKAYTTTIQQRNNNNIANAIILATEQHHGHREFLQQEISCILEPLFAPMNAALADCKQCLERQRHEQAAIWGSNTYRPLPPHVDQHDINARETFRSNNPNHDDNPSKPPQQ